jgi:16S rRNA (guanine1207-N2)-methyltransferase
MTGLPRTGFDVRARLERRRRFRRRARADREVQGRSLSAVADAMGAVVPGGLILIDGAKEEGIEAVLKALKPHVEIDGVFSKAHGKLIWFRRPATVPEAIADWIALPTETRTDTSPRPAAFRPMRRIVGPRSSWRWCRRSRGALPTSGPGWGYLAGEILAEQAEITHLDLIEADHDMLEAARVNVDDPRAAFHWADVTRFDPGGAL